MTDSAELSRRITEDAFKAILQHAYTCEGVTPERIYLQRRTKAYDDWMHLPAVRRCNLTEWMEAMKMAAEHLDKNSPPMSKETLAELLSRADLSKSEAAPVDLFEKHLETGTYLGWSEAFGCAMKQVPLNAWMCTDTMVGFYAYYFNDELAAVSWQPARKSGTELFWYSRTQAHTVRSFIRQLADASEPLELQLLDLAEPVRAHWMARGGVL